LLQRKAYAVVYYLVEVVINLIKKEKKTGIAMVRNEND